MHNLTLRKCHGITDISALGGSGQRLTVKDCRYFSDVTINPFDQALVHGLCASVGVRYA
jgi:hypothetical protein